MFSQRWERNFPSKKICWTGFWLQYLINDEFECFLTRGFACGFTRVDLHVKLFALTRPDQTIQDRQRFTQESSSSSGGCVRMEMVKSWRYQIIVAVQKWISAIRDHSEVQGSPEGSVEWVGRLRCSRDPSLSRWRSGRGQKCSGGRRQRTPGWPPRGWPSPPGGRWWKWCGWWHNSARRRREA